MKRHSGSKDNAWIIRNAHLHLDNTYDLYKKKQAWKENVEKRIVNATYERNKLPPALEKYLVPEVLKVMRDTGEFYDTEYEHQPIPKHLKSQIALSFARTIESEARFDVHHHNAQGGLDKPSMVKKRGFILAKDGFNGVITHPTNLIVGEQGKERVIVKPLRKGIHTRPGRILEGRGKNNIRSNHISLPNLTLAGHSDKIKMIGPKSGIIGGSSIKIPKVNLKI